MVKPVLKLFGAPAVTVPGRDPAGFGTAKCVGLLAYLTLEPGAHGRDELATLLWGESPNERARASLRQALRRLRGALDNYLRIDRHYIQLVQPIDCDVSEFRAAVLRNAPAALDYDVPRFFADFYVRRAPAFTEWLERTRRVLLEEYARALDRGIQDALSHSRWTEALRLADRWIEFDSLSGRACHLAMEALYLRGDCHAALARFAAFQEHYAQELDTDPPVTLRQLAERIRQDAVVRVTETWDASYDAAASLETPFMGREPEWRQLVNAWHSVIKNGCGGVIVEGDPGVGKSRLIEEFARWTTLEGAVALTGRCYNPRTAVPFGSAVDVLRGLLDAPGLVGAHPRHLSEASRLLPDLRQRFPEMQEPQPLVGSADQGRVFEAVAELLSAVAAERPVLVCLDNFQWCDGDSCALWNVILRRVRAAPVMLLAGFSPGEMERDSTAGHLYRVLRTEVRTEVFSLAPFDEEQVWALIRKLSGAESPSAGRRFATRVFETTGGNLFGIVELLKTLLTKGLLSCDPNTGRWVATATASGAKENGVLVGMPGTVRQAIGERVKCLPYELRDLLTTVAVSGDGAHTDVLAHVHGMSRLRVTALGDELVQRRLVVECDRRYRCAHSLIADVVRGGLTQTRRQEVHRALALSFQMVERQGTRISSGRIAHHAERGGERAVAYEHALRAFEGAIRQCAYEEAQAWLNLAAVVAHPGSQTDTVKQLGRELLRQAGWAKAPSPPRPRATPIRGIAERDLDFPKPR